MKTKLEMFSGVTDIPHDFKGYLLDAYGVFWGGNEFGLLPGSKEIMEQLVSKGLVIGILSNTTQLASKEIAKLQLHGLIQGKHFHFYITSAEVARLNFFKEKLPFKTSNNKFWLFGGMHPKYSSHETIFQGTCYTETYDISEADFIYISIPHINGEDQIDPQLFRKDIENIKLKNLPMVCPNPDPFAHEGRPPRAVVRQGSIAKIYEEIGGRVFYIGKPYDLAYGMAMDNFKLHGIMDPSEILMVGDIPETDIRGARSFGMPSALIIQTGIMADRISHSGLEKALKDLPPGDTPDYFIGRL